jgi:HNH endonuclease
MFKIKTIQDLIYWEYAKLIAESATGDRKNFAFVMHKYKGLKEGTINPSTILRENKLLYESEDCCAYCGATGNLEWEHIIPRSRKGPDTIDNMVRACRECNAAKGAQDPIEWYGAEGWGLIPRLVLGKYLKIAYTYHEQNGTLLTYDLNGDGKLDMYDIAAVFLKE